MSKALLCRTPRDSSRISIGFPNSNTCARASAGGSFLSGLFGKASVARSLRSLTPKQLGDEDEIDEDVKTEIDRVANGGADNNVVKVGEMFTSRRIIYSSPDK